MTMAADAGGPAYPSDPAGGRPASLSPPPTPNLAAPWLRIEGAAAFAAAVVAYVWLGGSWWLFAVLFLVPDLGMLGYLAGPRIGAGAYNLAHLTALPAVLAGISLMLDWPVLLPVAAVWVAHIGFDRMLGYGLKLSTGFHDTHLGRIGRRR